MTTQTRALVAGAETAIGSAVRRLLTARHQFVIAADGAELRRAATVVRLFEEARPHVVYLTAGRSAGIGGNQRFPADLMLDNLLVADSVIPAALEAGVVKLLYVASSCVYPKGAPQPFRPDSLWTGPVEATSAAYATAKLAGIRLCEAYRRQCRAPFITAISADVYGPGDHFHPEDSHVVGALIRRMHEARENASPFVEIWGSGQPRREFIYVDDLADACIFAMEHYDGDTPLNLGTGIVTSIAELASAIREVVGYGGELRYDTSKPDGMPFKGLDSTPLQEMGWRPRWSLRDGLQKTYQAFLTSGTRAPRG